MARTNIRLVPGAIESLLQSDDVAAMVHEKAVEAAGAANGNLAAAGHPEMHAEVEDYVTDRAASAVVILHPGAHGVQAVYGVLTNAAGDAGLELRSTGA